MSALLPSSSCQGMTASAIYRNNQASRCPRKQARYKNQDGDTVEISREAYALLEGDAAEGKKRAPRKRR